MAYVTPPTRNPGDLIASSDWNQYVKANFESLSGLIAYVNGAALSGWSEFTTARGLFILGLVSGGTLATAVGTPLTNQQNVTHTHTLTYNGWSQTSGDFAGGEVVIGVAGQAPAASIQRSNANNTSGTASAGSIGIPYIQLRCISKD